jgi:TIR domain
MAPTLFFSYSHVDEALRNQLEVHLSALKRQGLIATWHDRRITAGSQVGDAIDANLNASQVVLLLVSSDFIASDYCFEREMTRAMERHEKGDARIIPVILRPCDWHDLPFGKLLAAPRDGKPITTWPNIDEAFLDVERAIKAALKELGEKDKLAQDRPMSTASKPMAPRKPAWTEAVSETLRGARSSNLRVKKEFTDLDRDRFRRESFEFIARFFENSMQELVKRNPGLDQRFQRVDATHFTAAVYQHGQKVCKGSVSISGGNFGSDSIEYVMDDNPRHGGMNEAVSVKSDDQTLYLQALGMQSYGRREKEKLSLQGAAEVFWDFVHSTTAMRLGFELHQSLWA